MEWIEINPNRLPDHEVLAANFRLGTYGYKEKILGYLSRDGDGGVTAESDNEVLENVTHYIDINKFDIYSYGN